MNILFTQHRRVLHSHIPILMLAMLLTSITVSAFHNHHNGENQDTCAICTFHVSSSALTLDTAPGTDQYKEPLLLSAITLPVRISEPFHTSVFPSHAPPPHS